METAGGNEEMSQIMQSLIKELNSDEKSYIEEKAKGE